MKAGPAEVFRTVGILNGNVLFLFNKIYDDILICIIDCKREISTVIRVVSFSSCQQNLIKTFQIEAMIAVITKMELILS